MPKDKAQEAEPDEVEYPEEEPVELMSNGTIRVGIIAGQDRRLRRPFMGELRRFREQFEDMNDRITQAAVKVQRDAIGTLERLAARGPQAPDATPAQKLEWLEADELEAKRARAAERELGRLQDDLRAAWAWDVIETLAMPRRDLELEPDRFPSWFADRGLPIEWFNHWRTRPLAPGS